MIFFLGIFLNCGVGDVKIGVDIKVGVVGVVGVVGEVDEVKFFDWWIFIRYELLLKGVWGGIWGIFFFCFGKCWCVLIWFWCCNFISFGGLYMLVIIVDIVFILFCFWGCWFWLLFFYCCFCGVKLFLEILYLVCWLVRNMLEFIVIK